MRSSFTSAPKTASASSIVPTTLFCKSKMSTVGIPLPLGPPHYHVAAVRTRDCALHHQHVVLGVDVDNFQVPHRHLRVAQLSAHAHARNHARRIAGCAD